MALVACAGSDRRETATLLLAMAREKGMDTRVVRSVYNGYEVPDELLGIEDRVVLEVPEPKKLQSRPDVYEKPNVDENDGGAVTPEFDDDADRIVAEMPKRRGRPPGSKNVLKTEE